MNIVVLCGGVSSERDVSLASGSKIKKALLENGHKAFCLDSFKGCKEKFDSFNEYYKFLNDDESIVIDKKPRIIENEINEEIGENVLEICKMADLVFIALHGGSGENGKIQALFDMYRIKYTGNSYLSSALAMDKGVSRRLFEKAGVRMPKGYVYEEGDKSKVGYPCVVKLANGGSSIGVYFVNDDSEFKRAIDELTKLNDDIIVEEMIKGREFSVGILDGQILPAIEIIPKEGNYDYEKKYQMGASIEICPADISKDLSDKMQFYCGLAAKALGIYKYARADFLVDKEDTIYCLEMNALPGMTQTSLLPQEANAVGLSYNELCERIISLAIE